MSQQRNCAKKMYVHEKLWVVEHVVKWEPMVFLLCARKVRSPTPRCMYTFRYFNGVLVRLYLNNVRKKLYGVWDIVCLSHKQPSALVAPMLASLWKIKGTTNGPY